MKGPVKVPAESSFGGFYMEFGWFCEFVLFCWGFKNQCRVVGQTDQTLGT